MHARVSMIKVSYAVQKHANLFALHICIQSLQSSLIIDLTYHMVAAKLLTHAFYLASLCRTT